MFFPSRRDTIAGGLAGLVAGFIIAGVMNAQDMMANVTGLIGLPSTGAGLLLHLLISTLVGAGFGALSGYHPKSYASTLSHGLLIGLLAWIVVPLTLNPLLLGKGPTWSVREASAAFPSLIGYLLYGILTGLGFHALVTIYVHGYGDQEPVEAPVEKPSKHVLILGGGYGGVAAAQRLAHLFARDPGVEIVLVSQSNFLLSTPLLADVASSELEPRHISTPLRAACPRARVIRATVKAIDTQAQVVKVQNSPSNPDETLPYDHLVLALGSVPRYYDIAGLESNCLTLKTLQDAIRLRNHVISLLERADVEPDTQERRRLLTFVVAGAGFAGTEMLAALFDLVHSILRYYPDIPRDELRFVMIHSRERILPELSPELADYSRRKLEARGIEFLLSTRVAGATPDAVRLNDGSQVPTRTLIWTTGNQPNPLLETLPCELDQRGAVVTDGTLRAKGFTNVWAAGDCAAIPDPDNEGQTFPPTAQHALREGKTVADNIAAVLRDRPPRPFRFKAIGFFVALGHFTAAGEIRGHQFSGLLAWLMWRTVYWSKLPGLEKKVRVAMDWLVELLFPRDIVLTMEPIESGFPAAQKSTRARHTSQSRSVAPSLPSRNQERTA
jgi:NADH dehydrogenase